ncbi:hypothetical protein LTR36_006238 [Oleoguttula mirabilis]|uniref:Uncharacterized protein n=1 Tax=Oleoguttula mirabilis TaxID=1507867 RepID=A0AAV9JBT1_9PEZI|nr:hypothetical protein LTR36_006238 [Oleoguttula mirabilis]
MAHWKHLEILNTAEFTAWLDTLCACIRILDQQTDHAAPPSPSLQLRDLKYAPKGFWKYISHLMHVTAEITKALVAFLQRAIELGAFARGNVYWARAMVGGLRVECHRVVAVVVGMITVREGRARRRRACEDRSEEDAGDVMGSKAAREQKMTEPKIFRMSDVGLSNVPATLRKRRGHGRRLEVVTRIELCGQG